MLDVERCLGIVQNAEDEVVRLVEDLVTAYVKGNCLILVALPMSGEGFVRALTST